MVDVPDPDAHPVNEGKASHSGELKEKIKSTDRLIELALELQGVLAEKAKMTEANLRALRSTHSSERSESQNDFTNESQTLATFLFEQLKGTAELINILRNSKDQLELRLANADPIKRTDGLEGRCRDAPSIGDS